MPQKNTLQSLLTNLSRQGAKALTAMQGEIAKREKELEALKATEARWREIVGGKVRAMSAAPLARMRTGRRKRRLDWNMILAGLPATFRSKEVQQKSGKPMEQVYAGLSRWVKDKKIKKSKNGYRKVAAAGAARSQEKSGQAASA